MPRPKIIDCLWVTGVTFLILLPIVGSACADMKPVAKTANDAAQILCETAAGVDVRAKKEGLSVGEFCALRNVLAPFIEEALSAQRAAAMKTGIQR